MGLLDRRSKETDQADVAILAMVETIRDQEQPATASAVCALIGGAPEREVARRLYRMFHLGLLEAQGYDPTRYRVTAMGAELVARDLVGWSPSPREQRRRDAAMLSAVVGAIRFP